MSYVPKLTVYIAKTVVDGEVGYAFGFPEDRSVSHFGHCFGNFDGYFETLEEARKWVEEDQGWGSMNDMGGSIFDKEGGWEIVDSMELTNVPVCDGRPDDEVWVDDDAEMAARVEEMMRAREDLKSGIFP